MKAHFCSFSEIKGLIRTAEGEKRTLEFNQISSEMCYPDRKKGGDVQNKHWIKQM